MKKITILLFFMISVIVFIQCEKKDTPTVKTTKKLTECIPKNLPEGIPSWTACPQQYGVQTYGADGWIYGTAFSNKTAGESSARTRARQNVQLAIAESLVSDLTEEISSEEISFLKSLKIKDPKTAISNAITIRPPAFEVLEWYIEKGSVKEQGENKEKKEAENLEEEVNDYFIAHIFVRFPSRNCLDILDKIDPEKIVSWVLKNEKINEKSISSKNREKFVDILTKRIEDWKKMYVE